MRILSIETSCDETAIAILEINGPLEKPEIKILGNTLLSQAKLHEEFGGVFPALAKREHQKNLPPLLEATLKQAGEDAESPSIDCIAVTTGPGLEPALWTGIVFAKELGEKWGKPVIAVNHMEGHIFSVLNNLLNTECLTLPALALLVSGGHTELVHVKDFGNYEIIGRTVDDAVGEAYDKVARMLGLTYPGGPKISALAEEARGQKLEASFKFPRPMIHSGDLNFSYSGLKTAVLYKMRDVNRTDPRSAEGSGEASDAFKQEVALAFEDAAIEVLVEKTRSALEDLSDIKTLIVAGGVSANVHLQKEISNLKQEFPDLKILLPEKDLSTDNAIMIAIAGYIQVTLHPEKVTCPELVEGSTPYQGKGLVAEGNLSISSQ